MKNYQKKSNYIWILCSLLLIGAPNYALSSSKTKALNQIQTEIKKNNTVIKKKRAQEKSILSRLGKLRRDIYLTQKKLNKTFESYKTYQQKISATEVQLNQLQAELSILQKQLDYRLLSLYKHQHRPTFELIFNSESFSKVITNMYFYEY